MSTEKPHTLRTLGFEQCGVKVNGNVQHDLVAYASRQDEKRCPFCGGLQGEWGSIDYEIKEPFWTILKARIAEMAAEKS